MTRHFLKTFLKTAPKILETAFQIPRNSKFPGGACARTPLEIFCDFGASLHDLRF